MTSGYTISGVVDNGYRRARQWSGGDGARSQEHEYTCAVEESYFPKCRARWIGGGPWYDLSMYTFAPGMPQVTHEYWRDCINKCSAKVWGELTQSKFNAGIFAAEFHETYRMVCNMVHGLAKGIRQLKQGRFSEAIYTMTGAGKRTPLSVVAANHYMVWHFGILPTLQDIKAAYELMLSVHNVVKRIRVSSATHVDNTYSANTVSWNHRTTGAATIRGEVTVLELSLADRLGLTDPASVAWEATRLSWLLDWLLPVGNYLEALNASRKTAGNLFFMTTMQKEVLSTPVNGSTYEIVPFDLDSTYKMYTRCRREAYYSLPWVFPTIDNPLGDNLSRWVTSAAFLRQSVK